MKYLGASLCNDNGSRHVDDRIQAANRAFYSHQGGGLHFRGVSPHVAARIFQTGVRTILTYGCEAICISNAEMKKLETAQGKLLKCVLGLKKFSRTTAILRAIDVSFIKDSVFINGIKLLKSCLSHHSNASNFYTMLLSSNIHDRQNTLVSRCFARGANPMNALFNDNFCQFNLHDGYDDGLVDSIRLLLSDCNDGARDILQMLVNAF